MPLSPKEAAENLLDIEKMERRSSNAYGYEMAAPHLLLWGVIWVVGYGASYLNPDTSWLWFVLVGVGTLASSVIGWRMNRARSEGGRDLRYLASALAIFLFIAALFQITPLNGMQVGAFFPILIALFYALVGIWSRGTRMVILSIALAALTLIGYFHLQPYFGLWMAIVGGGGLVLGGLWLRTV